MRNNIGICNESTLPLLAIKLTGLVFEKSGKKILQYVSWLKQLNQVNLLSPAGLNLDFHKIVQCRAVFEPRMYKSVCGRGGGGIDATPLKVFLSFFS